MTFLLRTAKKIPRLGGVFCLHSATFKRLNWSLLSDMLMFEYRYTPHIILSNFVRLGWVQGRKIERLVHAIAVN